MNIRVALYTAQLLQKNNTGSETKSACSAIFILMANTIENFEKFSMTRRKSSGPFLTMIAHATTPCIGTIAPDRLFEEIYSENRKLGTLDKFYFCRVIGD